MDRQQSVRSIHVTLAAKLASWPWSMWARLPDFAAARAGRGFWRENRQGDMMWAA